jgi:rare lipoprotein A
VKVTNLKNNKSIVVRINDRGPHGWQERIIDLSGRAAQDLDMIKDGKAKVKLEVVGLPKK